MQNWKVELTSGGETLGKVKINIFQGDSLSPILLVITLTLLTILLGDMNPGYVVGESREKINHLLFMDELKLCGKTMKELDSLV